MQYVCLFGIVSLIYANEDFLLDNFNNNIESFRKIDTKTLNYIPSIQLAVNNKSDISQEQQKSVEDILCKEKLLLQWSSRLPSKYSGHYWVLMTKENGKTILFVTHNISDVLRNCTRTIIIDKGRKIFL